MEIASDMCFCVGVLFVRHYIRQVPVNIMSEMVLGYKT